jgi:hypothetical protein
MGNINQEIINIKTELAELEQELISATGEKEISIQQQILAKENQLTELSKRMPIASGKNFDFLNSFSNFHSI